MFPLKIGRWSTLRQGQKPLCKHRDKYQNMVVTLCRKSPNMDSEEIPKHLFIRVGTATWNSPHQGSLLPAGAVWDPTDAFGAGAQHPSQSCQPQHRRACAIQGSPVQLLELASCAWGSSYSWECGPQRPYGLWLTRMEQFRNSSLKEKSLTVMHTKTMQELKGIHLCLWLQCEAAFQESYSIQWWLT